MPSEAEEAEEDAGEDPKDPKNPRDLMKKKKRLSVPPLVRDHKD